MSLTLRVLTVSGTLANGREKLRSEAFFVSNTSSHSRNVADFLGCQYEFQSMADDDAFEIDPAALLALTIETELSMVNGECFDHQSYEIKELAHAQAAAGVPGARVMVA